MTSQNYPTDLTASQWQFIKDLIPPEKSGGRHRELDMRQVLNADTIGQAQAFSPTRSHNKTRVVVQPSDKSWGGGEILYTAIAICSFQLKIRHTKD